MTSFIWQKLSEIPSWAYGIIFLLVYIGIQSTRPIIIPVRRMLIMPVIFVFLSLIVITYAITLTVFTIFAWIGAFVLGCLLGWLQFRAMRVRGIKESRSIYIPGTWTLLVILLFFVALKLGVHYEFSDISANVVKDPRYAPWFMGLYGFLTGLFAGRVGHAFYCLRYGPFVDHETIKKIRERKKT